ncbi:MAG: D-alanyl-D-alanine carboxypeptidase family protein [Magnetococcales bacterium]|nr:D-alanyl-D-alanine carboxypeptidase family protein [Magnetococcales bacterium]
MNRRDFLRVAAAGSALGMASMALPVYASVKGPSSSKKSQIKFKDDDLSDYLKKVRQYDEDHVGDVYFDEYNWGLLKSSLERFVRLQKMVGHGNFYLLDFDEALRLASTYPSVGEFTTPELNFLETLFYEQAAIYGFYGEKPLKNLTDRIPLREVVKVPNSGNYLYRGKPVETWEAIRKILGPDVILTSGVRSVIKQFYLFLNKAYESGGNLSRASRSLAPPGYSFHGISDFDVGQAGYGQYNFTERFVLTKVYKTLRELGYLTLRYPRDNLLGVRFEPWHIKVGTRV